MLSKKVWIPLLIVVLAAMVYGLLHGRKTAAFAQRPPSAPEAQPPKDFVNPTSTSSNPLFADGVPEHLQCPPEWVGVRVDTDPDVLDEQRIEQLETQLETIFEEVLEKWNPNRPIPEIWTQIIERRKRFKPATEVPIDMALQYVLDFPEILALMGEDSRARYVIDVETGEKKPDWNVVVLHDGRVFRMKANYKYSVRFTEVMDVETGREAVKSYELGPPDPSALIHGERIINLDEMTDAEIASLGGWNYNINPYTTNVPRRKIPPDFVNPTRTSTNPLFADGVPEHLQCPPELVGIYDIAMDRKLHPESVESIHQGRERIHQAYLEILEKWNPNRPLTAVWPLFIEAEKTYKSNAVPYLVVPYFPGEKSVGQRRFDWQCQLILDFPEIFVLFKEDYHRAWNLRRVEIGDATPDLNVIKLSDGRNRTFRIDGDKKYNFTWVEADGVTHGYNIHTDLRDPVEVISVDLDMITDEELEALQGWDYNINPYTTGAYKLKANSR